MSTAITTSQANPARGLGAARTAAMAVTGTATATISVWAIAQATAGLRVRLGSGPVTHVGAPSVLVVSVLAALAALGTRALAERIFTNPGRTWSRLAAGALVVSLVGPLSAGTTMITKVLLVCMHIAAAAVLIAILRSPAGSEQTRDD
jgi:hypothetical protein